MSAHLSVEAFVLLGITATLVLVVALLTGIAAAYCARRDHQSWPSALQRGAAAFGGTLKLVVLMATLVVGVLALRT
ncbi:hypothetical protein SUDANB21_05334 [Streptomyces sp. enrichment culture]|uniref:hypothetical protein n=1 Tax=Streptomyces sp. enrichment culture TaxID=1795815 RepID=UPI003F55E692|nr:hypothetical protein OH709_08580 [Streptomyces cellulosae]